MKKYINILLPKIEINFWNEKIPGIKCLLGPGICIKGLIFLIIPTHHICFYLSTRKNHDVFTSSNRISFVSTDVHPYGNSWCQQIFCFNFNKSFSSVFLPPSHPLMNNSDCIHINGKISSFSNVNPTTHT